MSLGSEHARQSLDAALDVNSKALLARYGQCVNSGGTDCETQFDMGASSLDSSAKARVGDVKNAMSSAAACVAAGNDPSSCYQQMSAALSRKYLTHNDDNAGGALAKLRGLDSVAQPKFPMSGRELTGLGIHPSSATATDSSMIEAAKQMQVSSQGFDLAAVYEDVPSVNPLANFPNQDLIGRTRSEFNRDPFSQDLRPPMIYEYKPHDGFLLPSRRLSELESVKKREERLATGAGFSFRAYCN